MKSLKMYKYLIVITVTLLTLFSCNNTNSNYPEISNIPTKDKIVAYDKYETITIEPNIPTSQIGKLEIINGTLCYIDYLFCYLYYISDDGLLKERKLGIGNGPNEINCGAISTYSVMQNGDISFFGSSDDIYIYSPELRHKKDASFRLKRDRNKMAPEVEKNPDDFETYTFPRFIVCRTFGDKVYINNNSTAHGFNYFETPDKYAQSCRIITEYDIPNKKIGRLLGNGLPEMYKGSSDKNYVFSEFTFDIDEKGNFYIAFLADSLIYKFNKDFKPATAFGYKGKDMDTDYISITKPKDIYQKANEQYNTKGWYTWIEYIPEKNWLCRSYHKGDSHNYDGLQIYKDNILIADINVPVGFRPIGYIRPYLYSDAVVENDKLLFYKIKIN